MTEIPASIKKALDLHAALEVAIVVLGAESGTVHLLESDGDLHLAAASAGIPESVRRIVQVVPVGKGMAGLAVERAEPVSACNIQTDSSGDVRPGARRTGMEGAIVVPMMREGKAVGALGVANRNERLFTDQEKCLLMDIGRVLATKYGR